MPILVMGIVAFITFVIIVGLCVAAALEEPSAPEATKPEEVKGKPFKRAA
ncbi:MAG: hypothetical protein LAN37_12340 [Acidobacteriia bacterium]|nr:hypothetical protein [Terriglobia bacterium]